MSHGIQDRGVASDPASAIAWSFFEHLNRRDLDGAFALLADDATFWTNTYRKAMPKDATVRMLSKVLEHIPVHFQLLRSISRGNTVAMEVTSSGETRDHKPYDMVYAFWIEVRDGSLVAIREHADTSYGLNAFRQSP